MPTVRGCNLPEDLYYMIEKHVWARPVEGGLVRIGMTAVAGKLAGGKLSAVTIKGKSLATVESSKFTGPVPAPVSGILVRGNAKVASDPNLPISDPYGEGWIAEIQPTAWEAEKASLGTGAEGVAAYQRKLEADNVSCA